MEFGLLFNTWMIDSKAHQVSRRWSISISGLTNLTRTDRDTDADADTWTDRRNHTFINVDKSIQSTYIHKARTTRSSPSRFEGFKVKSFQSNLKKVLWNPSTLKTCRFWSCKVKWFSPSNHWDVVLAPFSYFPPYNLVRLSPSRWGNRILDKCLSKSMKCHRNQR